MAWSNGPMWRGGGCPKIIFHTWEIPRSGSKAKDGEKRGEKEERLNDGDNNGQATHGARKPPGPICYIHILILFLTDLFFSHSDLKG